MIGMYLVVRLALKIDNELTPLNIFYYMGMIIYCCVFSATSIDSYLKNLKKHE